MPTDGWASVWNLKQYVLIKEELSFIYLKKTNKTPKLMRKAELLAECQIGHFENFCLV